MYHFFVEPSQIQGKRIVITGGDVNHIKNVLRMKIGEEIAVSNGEDGKEYRCGIEAFSEDEVICGLRFIKEDGVELPSKIALFQGLPKADKMELIVQKAVELGVGEIIPVAAGRSIVKLDEKKAKAKVSRWQGIAEAAAKQSRRGIIPKISEVMSMKEAIAYAIDHGEPGDIIVLAGKGHEDYQEIKGVQYPMDERVLIAEILEEEGIKISS